VDRRFWQRAALVAALVVLVGLVATPAHAAAWGGGCKNTANVRACVSFASGTQNPVLADFYLLSYNSAVNADVYICMGTGQCYFQYRAPLNHLGRYPQADRPVGASGSARTWVQTLSTTWQPVVNAFSEWQNWN
jgi:hypothetical protein